MWSGQFTPFGQEIVAGQVLSANLGNPQPGDGTTMHYKFTGKERDSESGLDTFGARYYASNVGRWISADWAQKPEAVPYSKLDDPQSLNLYEYVGNNPLSKADADGHWPLVNIADPNYWKGVASNFGHMAVAVGKTAVNAINFLTGDCSCRPNPMLQPNGQMEQVTMGAIAIGSVAAPFVDAAFGGSAAVTATADAPLETQSLAATSTVEGAAEPNYVGGDLFEKPNKVETSLPGGHEAAQQKFGELTQGQQTSTVSPGHTVAEDGTRLRLKDNGTANIDRPASVTGGKHEDVHFNDPDKTN